jgi:hypothetical protein
MRQLAHKSRLMTPYACYSLEDCKVQIRSALQSGANLIYFHHDSSGGRFEHCHGETEIQGATGVGIHIGCRIGHISDIRAGKVFVFEGRELWPLDVFFVGSPCHPYSLLRQNGLIDDADFTPYFFTSKDKRDQALTAARPFLLEESRRVIRESLQGGANFIYYHHGETTDGFRSGDNETYKRQMRVIKKNCKRSGEFLGVALGEVTNMNAGEVLVFEGHELWPLEVTFAGRPCGPYALLRQNVRMQDADWTPYFFRSRHTRDKVFNAVRRYLS